MKQIYLCIAQKGEFIKKFGLIGETSVMDGFVITTALQPRLDPPKQNGTMAEIAVYAKRFLNAKYVCSTYRCWGHLVVTRLNAVNYAAKEYLLSLANYRFVY